MTKGHNKLENNTNDIDQDNKTQGQVRHLSKKDRERKNDREGRSPEEDPSNGRNKNSKAVG
jgi:hypothetical protein